MAYNWGLMSRKRKLFLDLHSRKYRQKCQERESYFLTYIQESTDNFLTYIQESTGKNVKKEKAISWPRFKKVQTISWPRFKKVQTKCVYYVLLYVAQKEESQGYQTK